MYFSEVVLFSTNYIVYLAGNKNTNYPPLEDMKISTFSPRNKVTTVVATPGQGPDRPQEVSYTNTRVSSIWFVQCSHEL